jgi:ribosomal protein S4
MSGKIYKKNLTFLQDQPFAENFLTGSPYTKKRGLPLVKQDSLLHSHSSSVDVQSFGSSIARNKSEKMKKAETSLIKRFCLALERETLTKSFESFSERLPRNLEHSLGHSRSPPAPKVVNSTPHLLVSVDSMRNTLLSTRSSRTTERSSRVKTPSQFKKILRECRKIRLLYGNLSKRHLSRAASKIRLSGSTSENLLIWLESRLDVVLERSGFFVTVKAARQSVLNGKILVNSKVVRSPGFILGGGDFIKVIQERLPEVFTESLNRQFPLLKRGVLFSNEVLMRSTDQTLFGSFAISKWSTFSSSSKSIKTSENKALLLEKKKVFGEPNSVWLDKKVDKSFDFGTYREPVHGIFFHKSFYTWLLKQKEFGLSTGLNRRSKDPLKTDLQSEVRNKQSLITEANKVWLGKKVSSSNTLQSWRFLGSPHLFFSLVYLHAHLVSLKVMSLSLLARTLNEGVLAATPRSLPTILSLSTSSISGHCAINILGTKIESRSTSTSEGGSTSGSLKVPKVLPPNTFLREVLPGSSNLFLDLIRQFFPQALSTSRSNKSGVKEKDSHQSLDLFEVSSNPRVSRACNSKTQRSGVLTAIHDSLEEDHVCGVIEVYNNLSTTPITSFTQSALDEYFSNALRDQIPLCFKKEKAQTILENSVVRQGLRGEGDFLKLLLSDLLFYSLLIKKEHFRKDFAQLKKEQLDSSRPVSLWSSSSNITSGFKQKDFNSQVKPNPGLRVAGANSATELKHSFTYKTSFTSSSRVFAPLQIEHKKIDLNQSFDLGQARRIKPLHLEVSYQSLCVVYLYPPQRVCLPVMIDVNCLAKAF